MTQTAHVRARLVACAYFFLVMENWTRRFVDRLEFLLGRPTVRRCARTGKVSQLPNLQNETATT